MQYFYCDRMFRFLLSLIALAMRCKKCSRHRLLMQHNVEVCLVVAWRNLALPINHHSPLSLLAVRMWPSSFDWQHIKNWLLHPRVLRWLNHSRGRLPGNTTAARNIKDTLSLLLLRHDINDTIIVVLLAINGHVLQWQLVACILAMRWIFMLVVAWYDLASLVAINLRRNHFLWYDVPRYARCHYLTINSAYCRHPLMDSMKNLIVASSRLAMVESLLLHPGSTTASRNIKKCYVVASMQW